MATAEDAKVSERIAAVRRESPESGAWLALLEAALDAVRDGAAWRAAVPEPSADRPPMAPCLNRTEITLDGRATRRWVRSLLKLARRRDDPGAASLARLKSRTVDALALLESAIRQQDERIDAQARAAGAEPEALRAVAQAAAMPLLQACGRAFGDRLPAAWWEGYCPVCAAWPALAEFRGLERKRWLRCGRCGTGWEIPWLRCPFCGETHHEKLAYFAPEGDGGHVDDPWRIEVCRSCKGYVKAVTTVRPGPAWAVALDDLNTVHLDLAALDRGYRRPERPGYPLDVKLRERRRRPLGLRLGSAEGSR